MIEASFVPLNDSNASPESLTFELLSIQPHISHICITLSSAIVLPLFDQAARSQQKKIQTHGFNKGEIPLDYLKKHFNDFLMEHVQEFLFKFCVINFLYEQLRIQRLIIAGNPRLIDIKQTDSGNLAYYFEVSIINNAPLCEWKYFPFKAPSRKNYKDLDRQVESFVNQEKEFEENRKTNGIAIGDWIKFRLTIHNELGKPIWRNFSQSFWFKISEDETETTLQKIFLNKQIGSSFTTTNEALQEFLSNQLDADYLFHVVIEDVIPFCYFCLEEFKRHFKIKTQKELHKKLIEVFSYRNDVSQRRSMVEEALKLLLAKHKFTIPSFMIQEQQDILLNEIKENPDYHVYRVQKDFNTYILQLAERQTREIILIDALAYQENVDISDQDVHGYLSFMQRQRMKEFIYFDLPNMKIQGQEVPISDQFIKKHSLREKTINYVIYQLTKK